LCNSWNGRDARRDPVHSCRRSIPENGEGEIVSNLVNSRALAPSALAQNNALNIAWQLALVLAGSALIAVAAHVKVPFWPVPATLQTLAVFSIAALYGRNLAVMTVLVYMIEGAFGLPVFTSGAGIGYFAGPTTGYFAGFLIAAAITGAAADRGWGANPFKLLAANLVGEVFILGLGALWIAAVFGADKALAWGVGPFIVTDLIKIGLASAIIPAVVALFFRSRDRS
jgi:biotin transport system substrate-specific component